MSTVPERLVGAIHNGVLAELEGAFDAARAHPVLVSLQAETGFGKTRIIQAFYDQIAGTTDYWPAPLAHATRKTIYPHIVERRGDLPFLWLGVSCRREGDRHVAVFNGDVRQQLIPHVSELLESRVKAGATRNALLETVRLLGTLVGIDTLKEALEAIDQLEVFDKVVKLMGGKKDETRQRFELQAIVDEPAVDALMEVVDVLHRDQIPLVFVVDDAHDADATTLAAIRRLMQVDHGGILVVLASWTSEVTLQSEEARGLGSLLDVIAGTPGADVRTPELPGMELGDLVELALEELGRQADHRVLADLTRLAAASRGNPLHMLMIAQAISGPGVPLGSLTEKHLEKLEGSFTDVLREHWRVYLDEQTRHLLTALWVVGGSAGAGMLQAACHALNADIAVEVYKVGPEAAARTWARCEQRFDAEPQISFADPPFQVAAGQIAGDRLFDETRAFVASAAVRAVADDYVGDRRRPIGDRRIAAQRALNLIADGVALGSERLLPRLHMELAQGHAAAGDPETALSTAMQALADAEAYDEDALLDTLCEAAPLAQAAGRTDVAADLCEMAGGALAAQAAWYASQLDDPDRAARSLVTALELERRVPGYHSDFFFAGTGVNALVDFACFQASEASPAAARPVAGALTNLIIDAATRGEAEAAAGWLKAAIANRVLDDAARARVAAEAGMSIDDDEADDPGGPPEADERLSNAERLVELENWQLAVDEMHPLAHEDPAVAARALEVARAVPVGAVGPRELHELVASLATAAGEHRIALESRRALRDLARSQVAWNDPEARHAQAILVEALLNTGDTDTALTEATELMELADSTGEDGLGDPRARRAALLALGKVYAAKRSAAEAEPRLREAAVIARNLDDATRQALAVREIARLYLDTGRLSEIAPMIEQLRLLPLGFGDLAAEMEGWVRSSRAVTAPDEVALELLVIASLVEPGTPREDVDPRLWDAAGAVPAWLVSHVRAHRRPAFLSSINAAQTLVEAADAQGRTDAALAVLEHEAVTAEAWLLDSGNEDAEAADTAAWFWHRVFDRHPDPPTVRAGVRARWTAVLGNEHPALEALEAPPT